jgi:hypothetical protein
MKNIKVRLLKLKVMKFMPKEGMVELQITYANESTKEILKTERVTYPESLARRIMADIRRTVKSAHQKFEEGEILDKYINVTIEDEDQSTNKVTHFLEDLRVNVTRVQNMKVAEGYMDAVRAASKMELSLEDQ